MKWLVSLLSKKIFPKYNGKNNIFCFKCGEVMEIEPFEMLIEADERNGLDKKSKMLLHRLLAIDREGRLITRLGTVDSKI